MEPNARPSIQPVEPPLGQSRTRAEYRWLAVGIAVTDLIAIIAAFVLAYVVRFGWVDNGFNFLAVMLFAPPLWLMVFAMLRLYSLARLAPADEVRRLASAVTIGVTGIVTVSYWTKAELSRAWVAMSWIAALVLLLVARRVWRFIAARSRTRGMLTFHTLIVGTNDEAAHLAEVMLAGDRGFTPVGFVRAGAGDQRMSAISGLDVPVVGQLLDIRRVLEETGADCIYVASSAIGAQDMRSITRLSRAQGIEVRVSANIPEMLSSRLAPQPLGGVMGFSVWPVRLTGLQSAVKRTFDLVSSVLGLVMISPLLLVIALTVRVTSKGPVLYRQERVGRDGKTFTMWKFRTMVEGAEEMIAENETPPRLYKMRDDVRLTRPGRFLRRWSLDELPQLANVVLGHMSLVGPRPPLPAEVAQYEDWHTERLEVRPGVTGLWQVSGRSELSFDDYVRLDLFYIENWSLAFDLYVLAKTIPAVLGGRGAY